MRIYYQDGCLRITSAAVWVGRRRYRLHDLDRAWRCRTLVVGWRVWVGAGVITVAVAVKAAASYAWWLGFGRARDTGVEDGIVVVAFAVLVAGLVGGVAVVAGLHVIEEVRRHARRLELWASVRGRAVLLVRTDDALRYGRVCRALVRALEDWDEAMPVPPGLGGAALGLPSPPAAPRLSAAGFECRRDGCPTRGVAAAGSGVGPQPLSTPTKLSIL